MKASEFLTRDVRMASSEDTLQRAAELMARRDWDMAAPGESAKCLVPPA